MYPIYEDLVILFTTEAPNINFEVIVLNQPGLDPTMYRTILEDTKHYTTDALQI